MMSDDQVHETVCNISYKPGWTLLMLHDPRPYLQWSFMAPDYTDGDKPTAWKSRKWYLSPFMTESEVVQTALAAALMAEEHEAREAFAYKGKRLFNPHISIEAMLSVCDQLEVRG